MFNFDFKDYFPFQTNGELHLIPKGDLDDHNGTECRCKPFLIKIEDHTGESKTVAIMHQSFDMREYVDIIPSLKLEDAIVFRKKYKENLNKFVQNGTITQGRANMKGFEFSSLFEEVFRTN